MRFAVLASQRDRASLCILNAVRSAYRDIETIIFDEDLTEVRTAGLPHEILVFASRHESESKMPSLLVHAPGNWGEVWHGGRPRTLCPTEPAIIRRMALGLQSRIPGTRYQAMQECTHHGPSSDSRCIFIEIGSDSQEWSDQQAGSIIADTIAESMIGRDEEIKRAFGIGGPHYAPRFNKLIHKGYAFGHICPKYALKHLDREMVEQAMALSGADTVCLDWKGLGEYKEKIVTLLDGMGIIPEKL